jgi:FMN reductase
MRRSIQMKEKNDASTPSRSSFRRAATPLQVCGPGSALAGSDRRNVPCEQRLVELGQLAPQLAGAVWRSQLPDTVERELAAVEQADVLVVATPVFRGSYTGLFKHFFDFIDQDALIDKPVLLCATGGSERHALVIDHQLRPLFSFFQARTLPLGVYATDKDFADYRVRDEALIQRARLAVQRALPLVELARRTRSSPAEEAAVA